MADNDYELDMSARQADDERQEVDQERQDPDHDPQDLSRFDDDGGFQC